MAIKVMMEEKSGFMFAALLLTALGSWALTLDANVTWAQLLTVQNTFSLMGVLGAVIGAWVSGQAKPPATVPDKIEGGE